jgi:hypothetical protein
MAYAYLSGGIREATRACTFLASWLIAREGLKHWPESIEEYCEWWKQSRASGYRELEAFKLCFPMFETATDMCKACKLRLPFYGRGENDPAAVVAWLTTKQIRVA